MWKTKMARKQRRGKAGAGGDVAFEAQDGHGAEQHDDGQGSNECGENASGRLGYNPAAQRPVWGLVSKR